MEINVTLLYEKQVIWQEFDLKMEINVAFLYDT